MREKGQGSGGSGIHSCCNLLLLQRSDCCTHTRPPQKGGKKKYKRRRKKKLLPLQNRKPKTLAPFSSPFIASFFSIPPLLADRTMATNSANLSSSPPLPEAPCHRSPPRYPDFYGKHRKQVELQILNREIGFLKEELQSVGDLKPASSCCKEYAVML
ncbi:hypothetical protein MRB53_008715 [Persea americana]|uniref:Uncharacterized protein n=1 Tax=Persea americana TaxID=3435 RepID=A0ACC2MQ26_PERAE|nr:hypothetical protein MRB53_008715 [Persea americana]